MIHLLPFGDIPEAAPETLAASLHPIFGAPIIPHDPVDLPPSSYDPVRRQHSAAQVLNGLARFKTSLTQVERVLGIVSVDLFAPDLHFVFGEADPREKVAVISIARLKPEFYGLPSDEALLRLRTLKEAVHELGHTYGLGHCPDPACVMRFSNELQETDRKGASFCPECASRRRSSEATI